MDAAVARGLGQLTGVGGVSGMAGFAGRLLLVGVLGGERDGKLHRRRVVGAVRRYGDGHIVLRQGLPYHQICNRDSTELGTISCCPNRSYQKKKVSIISLLEK